MEERRVDVGRRRNLRYFHLIWLTSWKKCFTGKSQESLQIVIILKGHSELFRSRNHQETVLKKDLKVCLAERRVSGRWHSAHLQEEQPDVLLQVWKQLGSEASPPSAAGKTLTGWCWFSSSSSSAVGLKSSERN